MKFLTSILIIFCITSAYGQDLSKPGNDFETLKNQINEKVRENWHIGYEILFPYRTSVTNIKYESDTLWIDFSEHLGYMPIRPEFIGEIYLFINNIIGNQYSKINITISNLPIEAYLLSPEGEYALKYSPVEPDGGVPVVRRIRPNVPQITHGLQDRNLVVSSSHGWMYDMEKSIRWEWQRCRLFTTVEDLHSLSYILPFLIPMLEQAGAVVYYIKDRDWQLNEVVLDDDDYKKPVPGVGRVSRRGRWNKTDLPGFKTGLAPYPDAFNPHKAGNVHIKNTFSRETSTFQWKPYIPETGEYGVYISYNAAPDRAGDARYTVYHLGGTTTFKVNQKISGNTWVWLGRFRFAKGYNPKMGRVELSNFSEEPGTTVCADAVKFGGGMGDIVREDEISGFPRYIEGARYWLQYTGAPPEYSYRMESITEGYEGPDYADDFTCRPEWANCLNGAPDGPNENLDYKGFGVPIDLYFSLHTDAGINDGIIGTLSIYRTKDQHGKDNFPDGRSRQLNRQLADFVQTAICDDARSLYTSTWSRRQLRNGNYAETRRGNVPSCLVELLSHQNFNDLKYGLDPGFRRDVMRATYKGILRFLAQQYGFDPIIKPLPPTHLSVKQIDKQSVHLSWKPKSDPLEPTAEPAGYIVYKRIGDGGFDNGTYTEETKMIFNDIKSGEIYSFKVEAFNSGGRSFPSQTLAVSVNKKDLPKALIVYGFDRISGPSYIDQPGYKGFDRDDKGVGYQYNFGFAGDQYNFGPTENFVSNDQPGYGSTYGDYENELELGNTFDYTARHGQSFINNGWDFDSVSDEAVENGLVSLEEYAVVDWILGEQRTEYPYTGFVSAGTADKMINRFTTFTPQMQQKVKEYIDNGGSLFVSGAYVATDLAGMPSGTTEDLEFMKNTLHIEYVENHGSRTNILLPHKKEIFDGLKGIHFSRGIGEDGVYGVELPDSIDPAEGGRRVLRYLDRRFNCGVAWESDKSKTLVIGFPFETIVGQENRDLFLERSLNFLAP